MPRTARNIYERGYRHIIMRGIGKQILFEDQWDNLFFINLLKKYSSDTEVNICSYCLMENHVHLLVCDDATDTALFMKKIGVSYSAYFNSKYERVGHLFQDRYKSENINDEGAFLRVLRYILRNPEKAGICKAEEYRWSSYSAYEDMKSFLDQSLLRKLLGSKEEFERYIRQEDHVTCMEFEGRKNDEWAKEIIYSVLGDKSGTVIQKYDKKNRDNVLRQLKTEGLSVRQIERLTGVNRGVVQKA